MKESCAAIQFSLCSFFRKETPSPAPSKSHKTPKNTCHETSLYYAFNLT